SPLARGRPVSSGGESHLRQHRAAEQAIRIGQRLQHLEVVVALADKELDGLAGGFDCRVEVARLALELGRLAGAVSENEGRVELVEMTLRAQRFLHLVRELDVSRSL